jgi:DNA-binding NarL/FixJ family response regulator
LGPKPEEQKRIRELFRRLAEVSDPVAVKYLQSELRHLLTARAPLQKPSPRQLRIIEMVAEGLKNREIAENLGVTPQVVSNYLRTIYSKIGIDNRLKLALWYEEQVHEGNLQRTIHRKGG